MTGEECIVLGTELAFIGRTASSAVIRRMALRRATAVRHPLASASSSTPRKLERENFQKNYESSAVFREAPRPHTLDSPQGYSTATTSDNAFYAEMEYSVALEEKSNVQAKHILELEASVNGQTVLNDTTNYAVIAVSTGTNKELTKIRAMIKQL